MAGKELAIVAHSPRCVRVPPVPVPDSPLAQFRNIAYDGFEVPEKERRPAVVAVRKLEDAGYITVEFWFEFEKHTIVRSGFVGRGPFFGIIRCIGPMILVVLPFGKTLPILPLRRESVLGSRGGGWRRRTV